MNFRIIPQSCHCVNGCKRLRGEEEEAEEEVVVRLNTADMRSSLLGGRCLLAHIFYLITNTGAPIVSLFLFAIASDEQ